jgi:nitroreductase
MELTKAVRRRRMVRRFDAGMPVDLATVRRLVDLATRAPSAGHTQGWDVVALLDEADRERFWAAATPRAGHEPACRQQPGNGDPGPAGHEPAHRQQRGNGGPGPAGHEPAHRQQTGNGDPRPAGHEPAYRQHRGAAGGDTGTDPWLAGVRAAPALLVCLSDPTAYLDRYAEPDKGWTDRSLARWPIPYWDTDTAMAVMLVLLGAVDDGLGALFFGVPAGRHDAVREALGAPRDRRVVGVVALGHEARRVRSPSLRRGRRGVDDVLSVGRFGGSAAGRRGPSARMAGEPEPVPHPDPTEQHP